jgi:hypothetical protein
MRSLAAGVLFAHIAEQGILLRHVRFTRSAACLLAFLRGAVRDVEQRIHTFE